LPQEDARAVLAYLTILATTIAGIVQASWWASLAGACILALVFMAERHSPSISPRGYAGLFDDPFVSVVAIFNGTVAAASAFALGRLTAWLWGA
jgi:hypothetical protein